MKTELGAYDANRGRPRESGVKRSRPPDAVILEAPYAPPRALVVDDEPDIRELLAITLGRMSIDVETAGTMRPR